MLRTCVPTLLFSCAAAWLQPAAAQWASGSAPIAGQAVNTSAAANGDGRAFLAEAAGAAAGSAIGFSAVLLVTTGHCDDDVTCPLTRAASAVVAATLGAAGGGYAAGRHYETAPSGVGIAVGSIVGAVAGIGMEHLISEEANLSLGTAVHVAAFAITQGILTAAGSRIASQLR